MKNLNQNRIPIIMRGNHGHWAIYDNGLRVWHDDIKMEINIPTNFVKANVNIFNGDVVRLLDEGEWLMKKDFKGKDTQALQFRVELKGGDVKTYEMKNATMRNLTVAYGKDSKDWKNKDLRAWVIREIQFGKPAAVLYLTPPDWQDHLPPDQIANEKAQMAEPTVTPGSGFDVADTTTWPGFGEHKIVGDHDDDANAEASMASKN